jgi:heterodisulfide reductase subunit C1
LIKKEINEKSPKMVEEVKKDYRASSDLGIKRCMQCGICTSNCPAARHSDYDPREMVKMVLDDNEEILENPDLWNCFYCYTCQSNCPANNSPCQVNQILRQKILLAGGNQERIQEFLTYGYSFMEFGVGLIPTDFFEVRVKDFGEKYREFKDDLEDIRKELGLGEYILKGKSQKDVQNILTESRFKKRLKSFEKSGES